MKAAIYLIVTLLLAVPVAAQFAEVGSLDFPTSARSEEAQRHFLRGVAILHSFGWKQAIEQFQAAQAIEPDFALAYWGETLSYNHPLFGGGPGLDEENPRAVLARLGPTPAARAAKAPTDRERGFLEAVEVLWSDEGTYTERRVGYMEAMERLYERYPGDDEVATFYALSMLSGSRALGDQSLRLEVRAGTIAMKVFNENRGHPGAVHYTIHAFDDPLHAPLALDAAHRYAEIAPAVSHARHMPTHIFIQHGMWNLVSQHNQLAHDAAIALWEPDDSVGDAVHSLDWGQYGDLQRGDYDKARVWIERLERLIADSDGQARAVRALPPGQRPLRGGDRAVARRADHGRLVDARAAGHGPERGPQRRPGHGARGRGGAGGAARERGRTRSHRPQGGHRLDSGGRRRRRGGDRLDGRGYRHRRDAASAERRG